MWPVRRVIAWVYVSWWVFASIPTFALAEYQGTICSGFFPELGRFGETGVAWPKVALDCPAGHAVFAANAVSRLELPQGQLTVRGSCCPLPPDALLPEIRLGTDCPADFVLVGSRFMFDNGEPADRMFTRYPRPIAGGLLKCQRLNTARYRLGTSETVRWATDEAEFSLWVERVIRSTFGNNPLPEMTRHEAIPPSLRLGVGRVSISEWSPASCIGWPYGAVVTGRTNYRICPFRSSLLLYTGLPGDPPAGTPVKVFMDCDSIADPLSPNPRCAKATRKSQ